MEKIQSFKPIVTGKSKILILGSMPGIESLKQQQYYANTRNQFWKMIFALLELPLPEEYQCRIELLQRQHIALWDVIASCHREGSLDSNIKDEQVNDFQRLFTAYPQIRYVVFNGGKAYECFRKRVGFDRYPHIVFTQLPSTSPAHAISFERKMQEWSIIKAFLAKM